MQKWLSNLNSLKEKFAPIWRLIALEIIVYKFCHFSNFTHEECQIFWRCHKCNQLVIDIQELQGFISFFFLFLESFAWLRGRLRVLITTYIYHSSPFSYIYLSVIMDCHRYIGVCFLLLDPILYWGRVSVSICACVGVCVFICVCPIIDLPC